MKIVIIGAGEVGFHLAKSLSELDYDISVIDIDPLKCAKANEHLDVSVIQGNGSDEEILKQANVQEADYVMCITDKDETNLISALQSHSLGGKKIVARLRDFDYSHNGKAMFPERFGVDIVIHPEKTLASEIVRLVRHPYADKFYEFEGGKAVLFSKKISYKSTIVGLTVAKFHESCNDFKSLIVSVVRNEKVIIPSSTFKFEPEDSVYFFVKKGNLENLLNRLGIDETSSKRIMIAGASKIGRLVAQELEKEMSVRLVESNKEKASQVATLLESAMILNADATDIEFLKSENINEIDSYIAVTEDQQLNLLGGIIAKQLKAKNSIIHVTNPDFVRNMSDLGLGSIISKNTITVNTILKDMRIDQKENVIQMFSTLNMEAVQINAESNSKAVRLPVSNLNLPNGCIIALVNHNGHLVIPSGDHQILDDDSVLIFCNPSMVKEITKIFEKE
jgi:trk system potassium uptake protein TrkA